MLKRTTFNCTRFSRKLTRTLQVRYFASGNDNTIPLAFDLHLPPSKETFSASQQFPAIVLMHGLFGSKTSLRTLSRRLAETIPTQVYTLDLRNHGDSTKQGKLPHSYELMAGDVERFIFDHGIGDEVVLAGHSMGAKVALYLALTKPDLPKGVISMENAPISSRLSPTFKQYVKAMNAILDAKLTKRKDAEDLLEKYEPDRGVRQFLMTNLLPTSPFSFRVPVDILGDALPRLGGFPLQCTEDDCPSFPGPALFIRGSQSKYIQPKHLPTMEKMFPQMQVVELDGSHWIHVDQPEGVFRTMYSPLARACS